MSSSVSDSESSYNSDEAKTRDYSDYEGEIEPSSEDELSNTRSDIKSKSQTKYSASVSSDEEGALCADDPVADAEWIAQYEQEMQEIRAHEKRMKDRLDGVIEIREWYGQTELIVLSYVLETLNKNLKCLYRCNCGNCSLELLQNVSECSCCREVQGCVDAMDYLTNLT